MSRAAEETGQIRLGDPAWIAIILTVLSLFAGIVMQWALFAQTSYVDERVNAVQMSVAKDIKLIETTENAHYIELLKSMNEIKVILQDKQDRDKRKGN